MNLQECLNDVVKNLQIFALDKNIEITSPRSEKPIMAWGDSFELERALSNVIYNAIKYSPENSIIETSIYHKENCQNPNEQLSSTTENYAVIEIKDYGIGINENDRNKIFDKLYRSKNVRKTQGTGLGLFISNFIIKMHHGFIDFTSELNKGSTFYLYLPMTSSRIEKNNGSPKSPHQQ